MYTTIDEIKAMTEKIQIGYWRKTPEEDSPLPWPVENSWNAPQEVKETVLARLGKIEGTATPRFYKGWSECRLCGCMNGSKELEWKGLTIPEGYRHYLVIHNVAPDPRLLDAIRVKK